MTVLGTHEAPRFKITGVDTHVGYGGEGVTTWRAAIVIALRRPRMVVAMHVIGRVASESDITGVVRARFAETGAVTMAVLMHDSYGSMLVPTMQRRKNETHGQKYEKAGDKAVPLHDPEQCA